MKQFLKEIFPGFALSLVIAGVAYVLGRFLPLIGGPVFGIALGIFAAAFWKLPGPASKGVKFTSKYILQLAVILLGFEMNMASVLKVGQQSLLILAATLSSAFLAAYWLGKSLNINHKVATLIGVGTAICGGSAIAAAAPAIDADEQEISYAISTIFLFNIAAVFLFPALGHLLHLSDTGFGMWAGTAINDTSSVVAAGYSFSDIAGKFATIVKLTRSLIIVPVTLALALLFAQKNKGEGEGQFNFMKVFPWFIVGFLAAAMLRSASLLPLPLTENLVWFGKFLIIAAMTAIGLNTDVRMFLKASPRALVLGALIWLAVAVSSLVTQYVIHSL
jgi:uncharacterized integral membrane protein (TIGR00698 family)